jgi:peptide/nickel transport system substrate-binding protein
LTIRLNSNIVNWDPTGNVFNSGIVADYMEKLTEPDWTVNPDVDNYQLIYTPSEYMTGGLAASWSFPDLSTYVVHLRQNVYWQNIPPANGRQFVASDVVAHWMRHWDPKTSTFTAGGPTATTQILRNLISVTATDNFTVVFKWSVPNPEYITEALQLTGTYENSIECPEAVAEYGNLNNWHDAIGTGPFMLTDFISGSSATLVKNPNYWGTDERYPKNSLPYIDKLQYLIIPDDATALSAMRTGKIDILDGMGSQEAEDMQKTNPTIDQIKIPDANAESIEMRNDKAPFNDVRVRQALQQAINLPAMAQTYYNGTVDPWPSSSSSNYMAGWGLPYSQWPQDLKDQYAYDPTAAKQLLTEAGYPNGFTTDIVVDSEVDPSLIRIIQSEFADINVTLSVQTMDMASWTAYVKVVHKDDALSMEAGGDTIGDTEEPIQHTLVFATTNLPDDPCQISDPNYDKFYNECIAATSVDEVKQAVIDCNEYTAQQHFVVSLLTPFSYSLVQPWIKGYNGQYGAATGNWGPSNGGFYLSRFWIDQSIKNKSG